MVGCRVPVISVCAVRTGAGKSPTSRFVADLLIAEGLQPAVIRHPMPYGDLVAQRVQRFATLDDLDRYNATIEEREDYEPHIRRGLVVWAGVDYEAIVDRGGEGSSDHHLGRGQQRLLLPAVGPRDRRGRSLPPGSRAQLPPG